MDEDTKENYREDSEEGRDSFFGSEELQTAKKRANKKKRTGISSEAYGKFNKNKQSTQKIVSKSADQEQRVKAGIVRSFLFRNLDSSELNVVIKAMEEKHFE